MNIKRVLVANRGEIAVRIIRSCRDLGIETVLAVSQADVSSLGAQLADEVVVIGPPPSAQSYLNVDAVMSAAVASNCDAIHPGYGFLSENKALGTACEEAGVVFIGASVANLDAVGDKLKARGHAIDAGLPVVPGGNATTVAEAEAIGNEIGYPLLIKAVGGGGGRGMQQVHDPKDLKSTMERATAEATAAFGDPRIYIERYVSSGRHVEVQILADGTDAIHIGDRDCSVQRRYQKVVEEAPAPLLDDDLREQMLASAVAFAKHLRYRGLGTVEFLVDTERGTYYFLEMNARIQVEHPVTEAITGLDLVAEQISIAEGHPLAVRQSEISFSGHAIECRINAEDPERDFQPSPGDVGDVRWPVGRDVRVDTHIQSGSSVPPFYDSMIAKLIVHGVDRADAVDKMRSALDHCTLTGITTNIELHKSIMNDPTFIAGGADTNFLGDFLAGAEHG